MDENKWTLGFLLDQIKPISRVLFGVDNKKELGIVVKFDGDACKLEIIRFTINFDRFPVTTVLLTSYGKTIELAIADCLVEVKTKIQRSINELKECYLSIDDDSAKKYISSKQESVEVM